ncbi:MAG: hypothetical protein ACRD2C_04680 [Acidimicrobiales bacterium]
MEGVTEFLDALASRLVPACDPAVVRTVFATASSGYAGFRVRDGRRASVITPSGVPFEASVTGGNGRPAAALRYVTEVASGVPFFRPRLTAQRAALDQLTGWLPGDGTSKIAEAELPCFVDTLFPDPAAVPARNRFATWFGIVHRDDVPARLAGLKVYGIMIDGHAALDRLAARWRGFSELSRLVAEAPSLRPYMADLEVHATGDIRCKVYLLSMAGRGPLDALAGGVGAEAAAVDAELGRLGVTVTSWSRVLVCCEPDSGSGARLSVHVPAKSLALGSSDIAALTRALAASHHGDTTEVDALDHAAAQAAGPPWAYTFVGLGLEPGGGVGKLNLYLAPVPATASG